MDTVKEAKSLQKCCFFFVVKSMTTWMLKMKICANLIIASIQIFTWIWNSSVRLLLLADYHIYNLLNRESVRLWKEIFFFSFSASADPQDEVQAENEKKHPTKDSSEEIFEILLFYFLLPFHLFLCLLKHISFTQSASRQRTNKNRTEKQAIHS